MSDRRIALSIGILLCLLAGCGGSSSTSGGSADSTSCRVGQSALPLVQDVSAWWTEGPGPTLALACLHDRATGDAMIVGYSSPEPRGGHCMNAYNLRLGWSVGEKCAAPGVPWNYWCHGAQGCVWGFVYYHGVTALSGMLTARVKNVRVLVRGRPLKRGIAIAHVHGKAIHLTGAEEPFGYFAAFIPRCVLPRDVKVELLDAAGSQLGDPVKSSLPLRCPKRA